MSGTTLVTGATGNAGAEVVAALRRRDMALVAAGRDARAVARRFGPDQPAVALDFRDPATWGAALDGCDRLFLMRPPAVADTAATLVPFLGAARAAGIGPVVFLSVAGAERSRWVPHRAVERALAGPGGGTILRPGFFMQNLDDAYRRDIVEDDRIYVPAGRGRVAFVDLRDVGEVAAMALADPAAHDGRAYTLTGGEALGFDEVAAILTRALGRDIAYVAATLPGHAAHLRRRGLPWAAVLVQGWLHLGLRLGQAETVDPTLARLLGQPPRRLRDHVADHVALWRRA